MTDKFFTIEIQQSHGTRVIVSFPRHQVPQLIEGAKKWMEENKGDQTNGN